MQLFWSVLPLVLNLANANPTTDDGSLSSGKLPVRPRAPDAPAQSIQVGRPSLMGTGCRAGTARVTLAPDNSALSALFDEFLVEVGGATRTRTAMKNCQIILPMRVPPGYQVGIRQVQMRGFIALPEIAQATVNLAYAFAPPMSGTRRSFEGPRVHRYAHLKGPLMDALEMHGEGRATSWSDCGENVKLVIEGRLALRTSHGLDEAQAAFDSLDAGIVLPLEWRRCR